MKKWNGYFTVEAAIVLPMVFSILIMTMALFFFQYDRCIMEQDAALLVLRGSTMNAHTATDWENGMKGLLHGVATSKYIGWEYEKLEGKLQGRKVVVSTAGTYSSLLPEWDLLQVGSVRTASYEGRGTISSPVTILRYIRKLKGSTEE